MGLLSGIKAWAVRREAASLGKQFAKQEAGLMGKIIDFLRRNKAAVGAIFAGVSAWGAVQGCPPVVGVDVLAFLHLSCTQANVGIGILAAFLGGAGLLTSDKHEAVIQGVKAPEGPPAIVPPAEVHRLEDERKG